MEWKNVKDEMPPLRKKILLFTWRPAVDSNDKRRFYIRLGEVDRPYDSDKRYNPDYYAFYLYDEKNSEWIGETLEKDSQWFLIEFPDEFKNLDADFYIGTSI